MRGHAVRISSHRGSQAELIKSGSTWAYRDDHGQEWQVGVSQAISLIECGQFTPHQFHIRPNLAPILFKEAVARAEDSVAKINLANAELDDPDADPLLMFVSSGHYLDLAVVSAMQSVVSAVAAADAQLNDWADELGWTPSERVRGVHHRLSALATRQGSTIPVGSGALQQLGKAVKRRNDIVHGSPKTISVPLTGTNALVPGTTESLAAREACMSVRKSLLIVADALGVDPPRYLAYCPDVSPTDDDAWGKAIILTGVRDDPVFPKIALAPGSTGEDDAQSADW